jgi:hypothetical protein
MVHWLCVNFADAVQAGEVVMPQKCVCHRACCCDCRLLAQCVMVMMVLCRLCLVLGRRLH